MNSLETSLCLRGPCVTRVSETHLQHPVLQIIIHRLDFSIQHPSPDQH